MSHVCAQHANFALGIQNCLDPTFTLVAFVPGKQSQFLILRDTVEVAYKYCRKKRYLYLFWGNFTPPFPGWVQHQRAVSMTTYHS